MRFITRDILMLKLLLAFNSLLMRFLILLRLEMQLAMLTFNSLLMRFKRQNEKWAKKRGFTFNSLLMRFGQINFFFSSFTCFQFSFNEILLGFKFSALSDISTFNSLLMRFNAVSNYARRKNIILSILF